MRHFVLLVLVLEKALEVKLRTIFVIQISLEIENALMYTYIFLQAGLSETGHRTLCCSRRKCTYCPSMDRKVD